MEQKLARAFRVVIEAVGLAVLRNVGIQEKELALFHRGIGFGQIGAAFAQGFYLGSLQGQSGFKSLKNFILIPGAAVVGHHLDPGLLACRFCATAF